MSATRLESILAEFGVAGYVRQTRTGPVVHTHLVELGAGVRVKKVKGLEDDIALRLGVDTVRVVPNLPGLPYLGVEVPKAERDTVDFRVGATSAVLPLHLGKDTTGQRVTVDLAKAPHLLVAGATGSGKSVAIHTMILSLLYAQTDVRFLLVDPKMLEFGAYADLPHMLDKPVTDAMAATNWLNRLVENMQWRYEKLAEAQCRNIGEYNAQHARKLPYIVAVVDEWADLYAMQGKGVELPVVRLAQKARAAGIHLILATQRPSVKVLPGLIKANFPARVALKVTNGTDSRVVLDQNGAERLLGWGDMLVSGFGLLQPTRVHGAYADPYKFLKS